jgi:hypothetical protein
LAVVQMGHCLGLSIERALFDGAQLPCGMFAQLTPVQYNSLEINRKLFISWWGE